MSNYASKLRSIRSRFPLDLQKRKLGVLVNEATRQLSLLPVTEYRKRQSLSIEISLIRKAISEVNILQHQQLQ